MRITLFNFDQFGLALKGKHKDLNSGLGVEDGGLIWPLALLHSLFVRIPALTPLYLITYLKAKGFEVGLADDSTEVGQSEIYIFSFTLVDFEQELEFFQQVLSKLPPSARVLVYGNILRDSKYIQRLPNDERVIQIIGDLEALISHFDQSPDSAHFALQLDQIFVQEALFKRVRYFPMLSWARTYAIQSSWGCPYPCRYYCPYGSYQGEQIRQRSAEQVVSEIANLYHQHKIKNFVFRDPIFGLNKKWLNDFSSLLKARQLNRARFAIETRPDLWSVEQLELLWSMGVRSLNFGIDTVTDKSLEKTGRTMIYDNAAKTIAAAAQIGFFINTFVVVGFPWETASEIRLGLEKLLKLPSHLIRLCLATPFAGTEFDREYGSLYDQRSGGFTTGNAQHSERVLELKALVTHYNRRFYLSVFRLNLIAKHFLRRVLD